MRLETILNSVYKMKSFVFAHSEMTNKHINVRIEPRKNSKAKCSLCGTQAPIYDHERTDRVFDFVPLWNIPVSFVYRMRRVSCPQCGVRVERIPWAEGKERTTKPFQLFLAKWARKLSWNETARSFQTSWDTVFRAVKYVVDYGLRHRSLEGISALGIDEIQCGKGQKYLTLVYQIDENCKRLLFVGLERKAETLRGLLAQLGKERLEKIKVVCTDMWKAYLKVIDEMLPHALNILDRFHIVQHLNKCLDKIRATEVREGIRSGCDVEALKKTKYCLLKNPENLTDAENVKLKEVLKYDFKSVRAYLLKESFRLFWNYTSPYWASWYLKKWCTRAMHSRLEPIKKFVEMIRKHEPLIMNWFKVRKAYSSGVVEGLNRKINLVTRKSYGFRSLESLKIALFHTMGELPEPISAHEFC